MRPVRVNSKKKLVASMELGRLSSRPPRAESGRQISIHHEPISTDVHGQVSVWRIAVAIRPNAEH